MNRVLKLLILSDVVMASGAGLIGPILAVFISGAIEDGSVEVAGFATTVYLLVRSLLQVPLARYADRHHVHRSFLIAGHVLLALVPFGYFFSTRSWHLYLAEALSGLAAAIGASAWMTLFSTGLTRGKEGEEWSVSQTAWGLASALAAGAGGLLVSGVGFRATFLLVGALELLGTIPLFFVTLPRRHEHWLAYARRLPPRRRLVMFAQRHEPERPGRPA